MFRQLNASIFNRFMTNGRTSPVLLSCEDDEEGERDIVVKLNGGMDARTAGAVYEVVGSRLASLLQLQCPEPEFVFISEEMANVMSELVPSKAVQIPRKRWLEFWDELNEELFDLAG